MRYSWILYAGALMVLAVKIVVSWHFYGTVDITSWIEYGQYVASRDSFSIYENIPLYNHPPLMSIWLRFLMWVTRDGANHFPQVFRLGPIAADFGSTVVLWKIGCTYFSEREAFFRVAIATASPILIMVSGFHGNTDPIFGFLILLAGYLLAVRRQLVLSALVLALSVQVKIVPLLVVPVFFFWMRNGKERLRFSIWFGGAALLGFLPHLVTVPQYIFRNIFLYAGPGGIWGIGKLLDNHGLYRVGGIVLFALSTLYFSWQLGRRSDSGVRLKDIPAQNGLNLFKGLAVAYVSFLALTPGFGVQYLSWLASLVVFLSIPLAFSYTVAASAFLFMVYTHWCCGIRWGADDSWSGLWPPTVEAMGYVAWMSTVILLSQNLAVLRSVQGPLQSVWSYAGRRLGNNMETPG